MSVRGTITSRATVSPRSNTEWIIRRSPASITRTRSPGRRARAARPRRRTDRAGKPRPGVTTLPTGRAAGDRPDQRRAGAQGRRHAERDRVRLLARQGARADADEHERGAAITPWRRAARPTALHGVDDQRRRRPRPRPRRHPHEHRRVEGGHRASSSAQRGRAAAAGGHQPAASARLGAGARPRRRRARRRARRGRPRGRRAAGAELTAAVRAAAEEREQERALQGEHLRLLLRLGVVVAEQVQDAVGAEQELLLVAWPAAACVGRDLGAEHDVAEQAGARLGAPSRPGRSSSIGKRRTSVGPGSSIHCSCRTLMRRGRRAAPTARPAGGRACASSTCRASATTSASSTSAPDSLATSMLTGRPRG